MKNKPPFRGVVDGKRHCRFCDTTKEITDFRGKLNGKGIISYGRCNPCLDQYEYERRRKAGKTERQSGKPKKCKIYMRICPITGLLFTGRKPNSKYHPSITQLEVYNANKVLKGKTYHSYTCDDCGMPFKSVVNKSGMKCRPCAAKESRRIVRSRRRARIRLVLIDNVSPYKVFSRDNWTCQQCGISTPKELRGKQQPNSPELDHIIPLSKGGEHSYSNTQCLCRACNHIKGDTIKIKSYQYGNN